MAILAENYYIIKNDDIVEALNKSGYKELMEQIYNTRKR